MLARSPDSFDEAVLRICADVGITLIGKSERPKAMETRAHGALHGLVSIGEGHARFVLRTICETNEGSQRAISASVVGAVSDLVRTQPEWADSPHWLEFFDRINLENMYFAAGMCAAVSRREFITAVLFQYLFVHFANLERDEEPRPAKPPPRQRGAEFIAQGRALLEHRGAGGKTIAYARDALGLDSGDAASAMRAATLYGDRIELVARMSRAALAELVSRRTSEHLRAAFESMLQRAERVTGRMIGEARKSALAIL